MSASGDISFFFEFLSLNTNTHIHTTKKEILQSNLRSNVSNDLTRLQPHHQAFAHFTHTHTHTYTHTHTQAQTGSSSTAQLGHSITQAVSHIINHTHTHTASRRSLPCVSLLFSVFRNVDPELKDIGATQNDDSINNTGCIFSSQRCLIFSHCCFKYCCFVQVCVRRLCVRVCWVSRGFEGKTKVTQRGAT